MSKQHWRLRPSGVRTGQVEFYAGATLTYVALRAVRDPRNPEGDAPVWVPVTDPASPEYEVECDHCGDDPDPRRPDPRRRRPAARVRPVGLARATAHPS